MEILEILLGQIPEAMFCALFLIYTKELRENKLIFTIFMIVEYLLLKYSFPFNSWFHILYIALTFVTLKVIYKEKSQITDTFIMLMAYLVIIIISVPCFFLFKDNMIIANFINKTLLFTLLFIFRNKTKTLQKLYKNLWNRPKVNTKIKSATFRSLNIVILNITFVVINICMAYAIFLRK